MAAPTHPTGSKLSASAHRARRALVGLVSWTSGSPGTAEVSRWDHRTERTGPADFDLAFALQGHGAARRAEQRPAEVAGAERTRRGAAASRTAKRGSRRRGGTPAATTRG